MKPNLSQKLQVEIGPGPARRLDKALAASVPEEAGLSRSRIQGLIAEGAVALAAGPSVVDPRMPVSPGTVLVVSLPQPIPDIAQPEEIPLDVIFEDSELIVVNKPVGLVVHPAPGARTGTLVNALLHHCHGRLSGIGGTLRPGIVHRIDKDTSGLLVVAKTDRAHQVLATQFAEHSIDRRYLAVTHGAPDPADPRIRGLAGVRWIGEKDLKIEGDIGRHPGDRKRMTVVRRGGKRAVTYVRISERFVSAQGPIAALAECELETGRTHQIRVHLSFIGYPLVGDNVYGRSRGSRPISSFPRQALHAAHLGFDHPIKGTRLIFDVPPPEDMQALITSLRKP